MLGSAIISDRPQPRADLPVVFEHRGEDRAESSQGLPRATYLICIASDTELAALPESLFIYTSNMARIFARREQLETLDRTLRENQHLHAFSQKLLADNTILHRENERLSRDNHYTNKRNWDLLANRATERQRIEDQRGELNRLRYDIDVERLQFARELDRLANEIRLRDGVRHNHAAWQQELAQRDAKITELDRHASELHRHYFAEVQRLRRRSFRGELRRRAARKQVLARMVRAWQASPLFDGAWYSKNNPDIRATKQDPAVHYALTGADEGRDPGPDFSTVFYLRTYPDVISSEYNPLEHYELFGRAEAQHQTGAGHAGNRRTCGTRAWQRLMLDATPEQETAAPAAQAEENTRRAAARRFPVRRAQDGRAYLSRAALRPGGATLGDTSTCRMSRRPAAFPASSPPPTWW